MSKEQLINIILNRDQEQKEKAEFIKESSKEKKRSFESMNECSSNSEPPSKKQKIDPIQERINKKCKKKKKKKNRDFKMDKYEQRHIALKIAYFGGNYQGFVRQQNCENTIEEQLFVALIRTCLISDIESCEYSRCGRTDSGVSALGNVIALNVRSKGSDIDTEYDYVEMLNAVLPSDIRMLCWRPVDCGFNARFLCQERVYRYLFFKNKMSIAAMDEAAKLLCGSNDFRNFCKMDVVNVDNFVRRISEIRIEPLTESESEKDEDDLDQVWTVTVRGSAFLWHQIRFMVAVLFMIGKGKEEPQIICDLLKNLNDGKPQYEMASDVPLILYDCVFDKKDVDFDGASGQFKEQSIATFCVWHQKWRKLQLSRM